MHVDHCKAALKQSVDRYKNVHANIVPSFKCLVHSKYYQLTYWLLTYYESEQKVLGSGGATLFK